MEASGNMDVTPLEATVVTMFSIFMKHQKNEQISKAEFKKLMKEQLPRFFKTEDHEAVFQDVDLDDSGSVNFMEFAMLVCKLSYCSYSVLQELLVQQESQ